MSHPEQRKFCESVKNQFPNFFENRFVLDIGSLDINGNNQELFTNCLYLGIDILIGKNVHVISKGHELNLPSEIADVIISTECFEHDKYYTETFKNILRLLKPGGFLVFTCATTGRPEHGTARTSPQDSPLTNQFEDWCDYYKNLTVNDFTSIIDFDAIFDSFSFSINGHSHDLYFWGIKKGQLNVNLEHTFEMLKHVDKRFFEENKHIFSEYAKGRYFKNVCSAKLSRLNQEIFNVHQPFLEFEDLVNYFFNELNKQESLFHEKTNLEEALASQNQVYHELLGQKEVLAAEKINLEKALATQNQAYHELLGQKEVLAAEKINLGGLITHYQNSYHHILMTNSWKITKPLREIRRWFNTPKQQLFRYMKNICFFMKKKYQTLPMNHCTRLKIRVFFAKHFPKFLLFSGTEFQIIKNMQEIFIDKETKEIPREQLIEKINSFKNVSRATPTVSVIIPVYGNIDYTLKCIHSIFKHKPNISFEIIVVDDCSLDKSFKILQQIKSIKLFKNKTNQGFIRSCNFGALKAEGEYLYFLNNDTQVTDGFLDELYQTFLNLPNTGLVGSKLIYPDGVLQEAGGILWQDGSAWNFGRGNDQKLPIFNYAREVDYCSGASIMLPKVLFNLVGGFDEHYLPAYCEDSDLALKIRQIGYRVIYQPLSTIVHFEGVSSGTDLSQGVKSYQVENSKKLFARWQTTLKKHQPNGVDVDIAKDRRMRLRVLVLDHCTPTPDKDAGSVTAFNTMLLLREMDFQITFIPEDNFLYLSKYTTALQKRGIEVLYSPYVSSVKEHLSDSGARYDLILLIRPGVASKYLDMIEKFAPQAKLLYLPMDLHYLRMMREQALYPDANQYKAALAMQNQELEISRRVNCSMIHSDIEMAELRASDPNLNLDILPLIIDFKGRKNGFKERKDILFIGGFQHFPNVDAMQYFVAEVMPILRKKLPGVCLNIIGSNTTEEVKALACVDIIIHGYIENIQTYLDTARISIAPLRYGAGVKGKVGTAIASGLPVVATSIAAEGMFLKDLENIMIANNPELFAEAIVRLYQDEQLWNQLSDNGLAFAKKSWSKEAVWGILSKIIGQLGLSIEKAKHPLSLC